MATTKFRVPNEEEKKIIRRNGVDPEGVAVRLRDKDTIILLKYKTRDEIWIRQGDRKWDTYRNTKCLGQAPPN